jgi:ABC-type nitrate/sulfonate/bicarbonate transport system permease component
VTAHAADSQPPAATYRPIARYARAIVRTAVTYGLPIGAFILLWELWSDAFGVPQLFPSPRKTARTFSQIVADGTLPHDAMTSMMRITIGFVIGSAIGALVGLVIGTFRLAGEILDPYVNFLRFISGVAWISVLIVWFGIGETSKVVLIVYTTAFGVLLSTVAGVAAVSPNKLRLARCFGANRRQIFFWVTLPATTRYILTGMRLSMANAFLVIVAAEMVQADSGLGFSIMAARQFLAPDIIFCGMITLGVLGLLSDRVLMLVARFAFGRYYRQN